MNTVEPIRDKNKIKLMKYYNKYTKEQLYNAFLLFLDENLNKIKCEKVEKEGNWKCNRCDVCMIKQYVKKYNNGRKSKLYNELGDK